MFFSKLKTGLLVLIAFVGMLLGAGGLAVGLHAQSGPRAELSGPGQVPEVQTAGKEPQVPDKPRGPHPVTVSRPARREAAPFEAYEGRTEAASSVNIRARVSGYLTKVAFKDGSDVKQGDLLFEIDPRPYQAELEKAQANLAVAEAHLKRAGADLARAKSLFEKTALGPAEYDKAVGDRDEAEAAVKAARAGLDLARLNLSFTKVSAPVSGRIGRRLIDLGNIVKADETTLATIVSKDPLYVYFDLDQRTVLQLRQAIASGKLKATKLDELPVAIGLATKEGYSLPAKIDFVNNSVDSNTGTVRVRAVLPNGDGLLLPGMFVRVRMTLGPPRAVLEIPEEAIFSDQGTHYVLVVNHRNVAERRTVTLGQSEKGMRVIEKGLKPEDWVAIAGLARVRPGDLVEPRKEAPPAPSDPGRAREH